MSSLWRHKPRTQPNLQQTHPIGLPKLAYNLLRGVPLPTVRHDLTSLPARNRGQQDHSHNNWTYKTGSAHLGNFPKRHLEDPVYRYLDLSWLGVNAREFYLMGSATLILLVVLLSKTVSRVLGTRFMATIGRYTFSLYLTHVFVIYTVSSGVVILFHEQLGYVKAVMLAAVFSAPVFWLVTFLFERYIDAPSIKFAKYVGTLYRGDKQVDWSRVGTSIAAGPKRLFRRK